MLGRRAHLYMRPGFILREKCQYISAKKKVESKSGLFLEKPSNCSNIIISSKKTNWVEVGLCPIAIQNTTCFNVHIENICVNHFGKKAKYWL